MASEWVEFELERQTCRATLYLGGQYITQFTVGKATPWSSATEGIIAALEGLSEHMKHEARILGIPVRERTGT